MRWHKVENNDGVNCCLAPSQPTLTPYYSTQLYVFWYFLSTSFKSLFHPSSSPSRLTEHYNETLHVVHKMFRHIFDGLEERYARELAVIRWNMIFSAHLNPIFFLCSNFPVTIYIYSSLVTVSYICAFFPTILCHFRCNYSIHFLIYTLYAIFFGASEFDYILPFSSSLFHYFLHQTHIQWWHSFSHILRFPPLNLSPIGLSTHRNQSSLQNCPL